MKWFCAVCALCVLAFPAFALDREAFTFTKYDLDVRVEPEQQRLGVRGHITLRNDSSAPQKNLALQISSTLDWRAISLDHEPVQFETHQYTSDIDHTGALSEAIVTLPHEVPPKGAVELEVGYEGIIPLDATRLTRIGVPEEKAKHIDWDEIGRSFTAVRGIGNVAWYPIATQAASLSEANSVLETVGRWMARQAESDFSAKISHSSDSGETSTLYCGGIQTGSNEKKQAQPISECSWTGLSTPTFAIADYQTLEAGGRVRIEYMNGQKDAADSYAEVASKADLFPPLGRSPGNLQMLGLPDENDSPFVTQGMLLTPLKTPLTNEAELSIVYALARQMVSSPRAWIQEGLSHYAQAAFIETQKGRQAALDYMDAHKSVLVETEKDVVEKSTGADHALITAPDDLYLQTKSMYVWWMLRDMLGNTFQDGLLSYDGNQDKDPTFLQKLIEKKSNRDLQWFFDDWVYHDRGLPDFRVASVFSTPIAAGGFLVTIEIENPGSVGAEVPIILKTEKEDIRRRLVVHAKAKASIRVETQSAPKEVTVNDGSVPESDVSNSTFKIDSMSHSNH
ncbi:MAG TPA: hypothetical protein VMB18_00915 [Terriglobales bacterium]|nr:hypothetical protein [Terriglobales bacterium]